MSEFLDNRAERIRRLAGLGPGEAVLLQSPFVPAPLINAVLGRGFVCYVQEREGVTETWIARRRYLGETQGDGAEDRPPSEVVMR